MNNNVQLLLHTDELWLEATYKKHFNSGIIIQRHRFNTVWLMLSYSTADPKSYVSFVALRYNTTKTTKLLGRFS